MTTLLQDDPAGDYHISDDAMRELQELAERVHDVAARLLSPEQAADETAAASALSRALAALHCMATGSTVMFYASAGWRAGDTQRKLAGGLEGFGGSENKSAYLAALDAAFAVLGEAMKHCAKIEFRLSAGPVVGNTLCRVDWDSTAGERAMEAIMRASAAAAIAQLTGAAPTDQGKEPNGGPH